MLPEQFWDLTWKELDLLAKHKQKEVRTIWDVARTIGVWVLSPHTKKKIKPRDLLKLDNPNRKVATMKDYEQIVKEYNDGKSKITG